jgi:hypothetical protein
MALTAKDLEILGKYGISPEAEEKPAAIPEKAAVTEVPPTKGGFASDVKESFQNRLSTAEKASDLYGGKEQSLPESALQTAGAGAGLFADIGFAGLKALTPSPIKSAVGAGVEKIAMSPIGQGTAAALDEFSKTHPRAARNLKAMVDLLAVIPETKLAGAVTKPVARIGEPLLSGAATAAESSAGLLKKGGEKLYGMTLSPGETEAGRILNYRAKNSVWDRLSAAAKGEPLPGAPRTTVQTGLGRGLAGTESMLGVQAKRMGQEIWTKEIEPALSAAKGKVDFKKFFNDAKAKIISETADLGRRRTLLDALKSVKDDYKNVTNASLTRLQKIKEGWAEFVPEKFYRNKPIAGAYNEVRAQLAAQAREYIYEKVPEAIRNSYIDYGNLKNLVSVGQKAITASGLKGGAGKFISTFWSKALTPITTVGGQVLYRTGEGLEFVGKAGAKTLRDLIQ